MNFARAQRYHDLNNDARGIASNSLRRSVPTQRWYGKEDTMYVLRFERRVHYSEGLAIFVGRLVRANRPGEILIFLNGNRSRRIVEGTITPF